MRPTGFVLALAIAFPMLLLGGCGGNASPAPTASPTPPPSPATPTAPTTPPATPSGGSGSGTSGFGTGPATVQYQTELMAPQNGVDVGKGILSITPTGDVTVQVSGQAAGNNFSFQFCPYPAALYSCFDLGQTLLMDGNGEGHLTFHFPKSGTWAGYFKANGSTTGTYLTTYDSNFANIGTQPLFKMTQVNPSGTCGTTCSGAQDPLGSGSVSVRETFLSVTVSGAMPNAAYTVIGCGSGGSDCYSEGTVTTDASGNIANGGLKLGNTPAAIFRLQRGSAPGFITGFMVP